MGATYGAVHVTSAALGDVVECVAGHLGELGFTPIAADAPEGDLERRVLVFEDAGWVTVADEDLVTSDDAADELGAQLSAELDADAIAIVVFHSDTAILARFRHGDRAGRFQVPEDGEPDPKTGHHRVGATFLCDIAVSPAAKQELAAGLLADHTFPEQTTSHAAALVGLPHPGAGARYLWNDPPAGSVKLRFALPEVAALDLDTDDLVWRPPGADRDLHVTANPRCECCVGAPLAELMIMEVHAYGGARIDGLGIELGGPGLALLDLPQLAGWNPDLAPGQITEIVSAPLEQRGDTLFAKFPHNSVAPAAPATIHGTSVAALRAWSAAMQAQSKNQFFARFEGRARAAGSAPIVIRVTDLDGTPLDANPLRVELVIEPAPRIPLLPATSAVPDDDPPNFAMRRILATRAYAGTTWLTGWIGFDAGFAEAGGFVLESASTLARWIGDAEIRITSAGTHPEVDEPLRRGGQLADIARVVQHLSIEADVRVQLPVGADDRSIVRVRHQPEGATIFDRETRRDLHDRYPSPRIVPLDLWFSLARPGDLAARDELGACIDRILMRAIAISACVGGFVAPMGTLQHDDLSPYEYLAGLHRGYDEVDALRCRPRSPGWRVIVPHAATGALAVQPGIERIDGAAGTLLRTAAREPFSMTETEREAIERSLLPTFA